MGTEPAETTSGPTWVVIPTYNEAETIAGLVAAVRAELPEERRILVVDDASPDGTGEIADRLATEHDDVEVLHRREKLGLGPAYVAGFRAALEGGAARIVQMDADFSHEPQALPVLLAALADADLVLGSRYVPGGDVHDWGAGRRAISRLGSKYARTALGVRVHDLTGGYKVWRRAAARGDLDRGRERDRLRLPGGDDLPRDQGRIPCRGGTDHLPRPADRRLEDDSLDSFRGGLAGAGDAAAAPPLGRYYTF